MEAKRRALALGFISFFTINNFYNQAHSENPSVHNAPKSKVERKKKDDYTSFVDGLVLLPRYFLKIKLDNDLSCNKKKLEQEHSELTDWLESGKYHYVANPGHNLWSVIDGLVNLDVNIANCFHKKDPEKYKEKMMEIIGHYERLERHGRMGEVYYHLFDLYKNAGYLEKAKEDLRRDRHGFEAYLKLTPREDLPRVRDEYLQQGDYLRAGKIEWYLGNRERGRELIEKSKEFLKAIEESRKAVREKDYGYAIGSLWNGYRIPFTEEIIRDLCKNNKECLRDLEMYGPRKNKEFFTLKSSYCNGGQGSFSFST